MIEPTPIFRCCDLEFWISEDGALRWKVPGKPEHALAYLMPPPHLESWHVHGFGPSPEVWLEGNGGELYRFTWVPDLVDQTATLSVECLP